jgi:hypothetical protein
MSPVGSFRGQRCSVLPTTPRARATLPRLNERPQLSTDWFTWRLLAVSGWVPQAMQAAGLPNSMLLAQQMRRPPPAMAGTSRSRVSTAIPPPSTPSARPACHQVRRLCTWRARGETLRLVERGRAYDAVRTTHTHALPDSGAHADAGRGAPPGMPLQVNMQQPMHHQMQQPMQHPMQQPQVRHGVRYRRRGTPPPRASRDRCC